MSDSGFLTAKTKDADHFIDIMQRSAAEFDPHPSMRSWAEMKEIEKNLKSEIGKNDILLGGVDKDYSEPVVIPYSGKSMVVTTIAKKGSGKSVMNAHLVLDNMHAKFGNYVMIIDPKQDYPNIDKPLAGEFVDSIKKFGMKPRGYPAYWCVPKMLELFGAKGKEYVPSLKDFESIDRASYMKTLAQMLDIDPKSASARAFERVIMKYKPKNIAEMRAGIKADQKYQLSVSRNKIISTGLSNRFEEKLMSNLLGENNNVDFPVELATHKILVMQTTLYAQNQVTNSIYIKLAISRIVADRKNYIRSQGQLGVIDKPVTFMIDEADSVCPNRGYSPSRFTIRSLATKERATGMSVFLITQNPTFLDQAIIKESDFIIVSKLFSEEEKAVLTARGVPKYIIGEVMKKLEWKDTSPVKQFAIILPDSEDMYKTFYPIACACSFQKEGTYG